MIMIKDFEYVSTEYDPANNDSSVTNEELKILSDKLIKRNHQVYEELAKWDGFLKKKILELHSDLVNEFGGKTGVRDDELLESAICAPFQTFGGDDLYPELLEKSARLAYGIIRNHPFYDGNKRLGLHLMLLFQELNGISIQYQAKDVVELIISVASGKTDEESLYSWVKEHY